MCAGCFRAFGTDLIGGSNGRMSLVRQVSLGLRPRNDWNHVNHVMASINQMRRCSQRLFAEPHFLALEHLVLDLTRAGAGLLGLDMVSYRKPSKFCFAKRPSQLELYKFGHSRPPRLQKLTVEGIAPTLTRLKKIRELFPPGVQVVLKNEKKGVEYNISEAGVFFTLVTSSEYYEGKHVISFA